ncbi:Nucleoredoxin, partial [Actinidia chinensis var. chinensis]
MDMEPDSSETVTDLRPPQGYSIRMLLDLFEAQAEGEAEAQAQAQAEAQAQAQVEVEAVDVIYTDRPSLHNHRLAFSNNFKSGGDCVVCNQQITGPHYSCPSCPKFFIHRYPCFEVSDYIQHHPFHPQHTLTLIHSRAYSEDLYYSCDVCSNDFDAGGYVYSCDECTFYMDVKCASLSLTDCKSHDHQLSPLHPHPLILCDKNSNFCYKCTFCELPIEIERGSLYACLQCRALLHKSCADLPQKMEHPLHPSHPLILVYSRIWVTCQVCCRKMLSICYYCSECKFYMDVHCAALKPTENNKGYKLCADLPQQIDHLLHPQHFLLLRHSSGLTDLDQTLPCGACLRYSRGIFFECQLCRWYIDVGCALAKYTPMRSKIHPHPLIFFDKANNLFECNSCGRCCYTPFFRCFRCDFNLHVHCVSILPRTLKSNNHVHPLTLTDSPIKDHADEDDNAEFYCGACEELRVLADPSYYCEECTYVAHPHCIVSK